MNERNEHEVERLGEIESESGPNRRRNLVIAGAAVTVTAAVLATVFTSMREPAGESGVQGETRRVALSSVGHPLEIAEAQIAQSQPVAQQALNGTLPAPENAPTDINAGIPAQALAAYRKAEAGAGAEFPDCKVPWWVVAGMGKVASDHAAGTTFDATGTTLAQIRGTRLDGRTIGTSLVADTDGGQLDGDAQYDRAMGPMQFLPGMWYLDARDGNADGLANPDNIDDAALGATAVLCEGGDDLSTPDGLTKGLYRYTASADAVNGILTWGAFYKANVTPAPATATPVPVPSGPKPIPTTEPADLSATRGGSVPTSGAPAVPGTPPASGAPASPGQTSSAPAPTTPAQPAPVIPPRSTVMPTPAPAPTTDAPRPTQPQAPEPTREPEPTRAPEPTRTQEPP
ncbi:MAG: hypothetical protein Q4G51_16540, partial [Dermatophilus congolensis]|nr:hypothetical protein [Dermatophilus congolensis]